MKNIIYKIISNIRQKLVAPKVYAIVLKVNNYQYLSLQSAYSLEEAFGKAKKTLADSNASLGLPDIELSKIDMFIHSEADDLFADYRDEKLAEVQEVPQTLEIAQNVSIPEGKNSLMKKIIDTHDLKLLEENRSKFSEAEVRYLKVQINKK